MGLGLKEFVVAGSLLVAAPTLESCSKDDNETTNPVSDFTTEQGLNILDIVDTEQTAIVDGEFGTADGLSLDKGPLILKNFENNDKDTLRLLIIGADSNRPASTIATEHLENNTIRILGIIENDTARVLWDKNTNTIMHPSFNSTELNLEQQQKRIETIESAHENNLEYIHSQ